MKQAGKGPRSKSQNSGKKEVSHGSKRSSSKAKTSKGLRGSSKGDGKTTHQSSFSGIKKKGSDQPVKDHEERREKKPFEKKTGGDKPSREKETQGEKKSYKSSRSFDQNKTYRKSSSSSRPVKTKEKKSNDGLIRLNKYIANAGICSRREADTIIQSGAVTVNGVVVTELGHKINPGDKVGLGGKTIQRDKPVYILVNKPKDYITTTKDPNNRKTVMELVRNACKERVFPVGRLDRNTTGLILLTNDGVMADKLMHPRKSVDKIYHVEVDKVFKTGDLEKLSKGLELEDGFFCPDEVAYVENSDRKHIGIRIHSGKNRIVRRLFEHLGYDVLKLDRVIYAGLTKKNLPRGHWRMLTQEEVNLLHMI